MQISYELIRSRRRTLSMEVTRDARVVVRAPARCAKREIERFVEEHRDWLSEHLAHARERQLRHPEPTPEQEAALRERARRELPQKLAYYAEMMGLHPAGMRITSARTRFGSCSARNSICLIMWLCTSWRIFRKRITDARFMRWSGGTCLTGANAARS